MKEKMPLKEKRKMNRRTMVSSTNNVLKVLDKGLNGKQGTAEWII